MIWFTVNRHAAEVCYWHACAGMPKPISLPFPPGVGRIAVTSKAPHYTGSLDAALKLVPPGYNVVIEIASYQDAAWVNAEGGRLSSCYGKKLGAARTLAIAALRAKLALGRGEQKNG